MAYGQKSLVICRTSTDAIKGSQIIEQIFVEPDLMDEKVFVKKLNEVADDWYHKNPDIRLLLVTPVSDSYAELVSKNQLELKAKFDLNVPDWQTYQKVTDKVEFYKLCEKYNLDYPKFVVVNSKTPLDSSASNGVNFPIVIKPNDSAAYWRLPRFTGYQKVYFADDLATAREILYRVYKNGYKGEMLIQEKIESPIFAQQDTTTYSGLKTRKTQFSQVFQAVLAENYPLAFGVFCALVPTKNVELEAKLAKFLDAIKYRGFAGFNIIIDPRDNKPKLLELNARLHGESYALTITGNNPAQILVSDIYGPEKFVKTEKEGLWRSVPNRIIRHYTPDGSLKNRVLKLIKQGKTDTELKYPADLSLSRFKKYLVFMLKRARSFKKFARQSAKKC